MPVKTPNFWMQTYTGILFDLEHPTADMIEIKDIAHHLSLINRFNGATDRHYSVAQHSVIVAKYMPGDATAKLCALLHDAHEAYTGDLVAPLKFLLSRETSAFRAVEGKIQNVIGEKFGLPNGLTLWEQVKKLDLELLMKEKELLLGPAPAAWDLDGKVKPLPVYIETLSPAQAEQDFLRMFESLEKLRKEGG